MGDSAKVQKYKEKGESLPISFFIKTAPSPEAGKGAVLGPFLQKQA
jgi:hypothetical protein